MARFTIVALLLELLLVGRPFGRNRAVTPQQAPAMQHRAVA